jgi:hypothetical protein
MLVWAAAAKQGQLRIRNPHPPDTGSDNCKGFGRLGQFKTEQSWSRRLRPGLFGAINYIYIPSPALPCHKYEFHILASSYRFTDVEYTFVRR